jgi:predicted dehydrogenase
LGAPGGREWFHPNPDFLYKPGGGPLLDIGPYYVTALVSLLGAGKRCCAMSRRTFARRVIESRPNKGKTIDMAYAIRERRPERASGAMGLHCLEIMESLLASTSEGRFCHLKSSCARPEPLAANFPESES